MRITLETEKQGCDLHINKENLDFVCLLKYSYCEKKVQFEKLQNKTLQSFIKNACHSVAEVSEVITFIIIKMKQVIFKQIVRF